jgi:antitoxin component of RelBE/YafQ-DinJ toxin-antitoxin module
MSNESATISATVPASVKAEARAILAAHGVSMARLLREFLTRVAAHDAETLARLDEASRCTQQGS